MKLLPWSVSISLGISTLENKLIEAFETVLVSQCTCFWIFSSIIDTNQNETIFLSVIGKGPTKSKAMR
jgi:hypothetical protein